MQNNRQIIDSVNQVQAGIQVALVKDTDGVRRFASTHLPHLAKRPLLSLLRDEYCLGTSSSETAGCQIEQSASRSALKPRMSRPRPAGEMPAAAWARLVVIHAMSS